MEFGPFDVDIIPVARASTCYDLRLGYKLGHIALLMTYFVTQRLVVGLHFEL